MSVVQEPVTDGVGQRGLADVVVPLGGRQLAGDDRRPQAVAILEDLEDVAPLLVLERGEGQSSMSKTSMRASLPRRRT
jgi:hypothetical protein